MKFSFRWLLNFVDKFCCDYQEYQTQKVIFFSATVVLSSVMPKKKTRPFRGHEKGWKGHPRLSEFSVYPNGPTNWVQPVRIISENALYQLHANWNQRTCNFMDHRTIIKTNRARWYFRRCRLYHKHCSWATDVHSSYMTCIMEQNMVYCRIHACYTENECHLSTSIGTAIANNIAYKLIYFLSQSPTVVINFE